MTDWVGKSKQSLIKSWGPAIRAINNGENGEILIYADQVYANQNNKYNSEETISNYWNYTYVYINRQGKVESWRKERQVYPPQQISAVSLLGKYVVSVK